MDTSDAIKLRFQQALRDERERRQWSQRDLSKMLDAKGITLAPTGIAKIENGTRAVSVSEASAIADLLGVSLDALLGRDVRPEADALHVIRTTTDTAQEAAVQLGGIAERLRARLADLTAADEFGQRDMFADACRSALDAVTEANAALFPIWGSPQARAVADGQRKLEMAIAATEKRSKK